MISSKLTTVDSGILSHHFIPENTRALVARRTESGKLFGKLDLVASPPDLVAGTDKYPPRNIVAGFLLDTSGSMEGNKLKQAVNTIKQFAQVFLAERNGKTLEHQPIHAWIYVISFNSNARLVVPFQEITEETLPRIFEQLENGIYPEGSTNYEAAFKKQAEVLCQIIEELAAANAAAATTTDLSPTRRQFHFIRFFETDGEITQGTTNIRALYKMMRQTPAIAAAAADHLNLTFEDYVIGYGTDVDLLCLKKLASATPPPSQFEEVSSALTQHQHQQQYNCSSLITVVKPEDIGWQVGEILFKLIRRVGIKVKVSIESKDPAAGIAELFEYETHQWSHQTTFHSIIHNEKKSLYIQFTPANPAANPNPELIVKIQCENQFSGTRYRYEYSHESRTSISSDPSSLLLRPLNSMTPAERGLAASENDRAKQVVIPIIQGMIQIEIFKQFRELEANSSSYDKDVIVREAYKTMRMLKAIDRQTKASFPYSIAPKNANLITDVKLIIGMTAVKDPKEQQCLIHARRIASAQEDIFNTGADVSRKYVENEEDYEDIAREVIQKRDGVGALSQQQQQQQQDPVAQAPETEPEEYADDDAAELDDSLPSRIATCMPTPSRGGGGGGYNRHYIRQKPSILRLLCARIALSKLNNQDRSPETIYSEMNKEFVHYGGEHDEDPSYHYTRHTHQQDDTFSSTPSQDDEYTQRRMGMMRQMSSPSSS